MILAAKMCGDHSSSDEEVSDKNFRYCSSITVEQTQLGKLTAYGIQISFDIISLQGRPSKCFSFRTSPSRVNL
jgi:hypothetical protein